MLKFTPHSSDEEMVNAIYPEDMILYKSVIIIPNNLYMNNLNEMLDRFTYAACYRETILFSY